MTKSTVTAHQLVVWRKNHGWGRGFAAGKLGLSVSCMGNYERGARSTGEKVEIPLTVALAMSAIDAGLRPYTLRMKSKDLI